ncbi:MAG TPA: nucleotide pyrophosphohydrolase [Burkholderiaceae bacterium]
MSDSLHALRDELRRFAGERDWGQFHTPKNLSSALSVEAAELLEHFQWLQNGELAELGVEARAEVAHEMADVLCYLVMLADRLEVDLLDAARTKIALNRAKYPAEQVRGDARKYTAYRRGDGDGI